jgi:hypothetical protein
VKGSSELLARAWFIRLSESLARDQTNSILELHTCLIE